MEASALTPQPSAQWEVLNCNPSKGHLDDKLQAGVTAAIEGAKAAHPRMAKLIEKNVGQLLGGFTNVTLQKVLELEEKLSKVLNKNTFVEITALINTILHLLKLYRDALASIQSDKPDKCEIQLDCCIVMGGTFRDYPLDGNYFEKHLEQPDEDAKVTTFHIKEIRGNPPPDFWFLLKEALSA